MDPIELRRFGDVKCRLVSEIEAKPRADHRLARRVAKNLVVDSFPALASRDVLQWIGASR